MSLAMVRSVLSNLNSTTAWTVSLVKIRNSKRAGTTYAARGITLSPEGALTRFVSGLSKVYTEGDEAAINKYSAVTEYDGSAEAIKIYKLQSDNELIADEYSRIIEALSSPETTGDPLEFSANAYALKGSFDVEGEERTVILFSLQNPICVLKNRFLYDEGTFFELNKKVLNLRQNIDVIIIDDTVYLLTLAGEKPSIWNVPTKPSVLQKHRTFANRASYQISTYSRQSPQVAIIHDVLLRLIRTASRE